MIATDGTWNPDERGLYFLAGSFMKSAFELVAGPRPTRFLVALNDLVAVDQEPGDELALLDYHLALGHDVFLDSGVFWLTNRHKDAHGVSMNDALALHPTEIDHFDWLYDSFVTVCTRYRDRLWGYTEIDQGGAERKRETRAKLHAAGLNPIPVYHPLNDGWDYFDELCTTHDRVAFGNVVQAARPTRMRLLATGTERHREYPGTFIHWLGLTPCDLTLAYPFDSCDSSSWLGAARWASNSATSMSHARFATPHEASYRLGDGASSVWQRAALFIEQDARQTIIDHWSQRLTNELDFVTYPVPA